MITILGLPQLQAKLRALPVIADRAAKVGRGQGANRVAAEAQSRVPVRTGATRASIAVTVAGEGEAVVASQAAVFLEFGTVHMAAQPFLVPAFEQERDQVVEDIADAVQTALVRL